MRKLWHHIKLFVVMCHADYWTDFERLRTKYKKPKGKQRREDLGRDPQFLAEVRKAKEYFEDNDVAM